MKNIKLTLLVLSILVLGSSFRGQENQPSREALKVFQEQFKGASNVEWRTEPPLAIASFNLNQSHFVAYFSEEGELLGAERAITFNAIPFIPLKAVSDRFPEAVPYDIVEFSQDWKTYYIMTVESAGKKIRISVSTSGDITVQKKERLNNSGN